MVFDILYLMSLVILLTLMFIKMGSIISVFDKGLKWVGEPFNGPILLLCIVIILRLIQLFIYII